MAERFSLLRHEKAAYWAKGCPLLLLSHAITKDNNSGAVFAQLKFENHDVRAVKAVYVSLRCADTLGQPIADPVQYSYLDLNAPQGCVFGDKKPLPLPADARNFTLTVEKILFADETLWQGEGTFEALSFENRQEISSLGDLADQYIRELGLVANMHTHLPYAGQGYCICGCGEILFEGETHCKTCGVSLPDLLPLTDTAYLTDRLAQFEEEQAEKAAREKEAAEKKAAEEAAQKERTRKVLITVGAAVAAIVLLFTVILPAINMGRARKLYNDGDYAAAVEIMEKSHSSKKGQKLYGQCLLAYGIELVDNGQFSEAFEVVEVAGLLSDEDIANEALKVGTYAAMCEILDTGELSMSYPLYVQYKEDPLFAKHADVFGGFESLFGVWKETDPSVDEWEQSNDYCRYCNATHPFCSYTYISGVEITIYESGACTAVLSFEETRVYPPCSSPYSTGGSTGKTKTERKILRGGDAVVFLGKEDGTYKIQTLSGDMLHILDPDGGEFYLVKE